MGRTTDYARHSSYTYVPSGCCRRSWPAGRAEGSTPLPWGARTSTGSCCASARCVSPIAGKQLTAHWASSVAKAAGLVVREATEMGFVPGLGPTFAFRRGDARWPVAEDEEGLAARARRRPAR